MERVQAELTPEEYAALIQMAQDKDMSMSGVLKHALRLCNYCDSRLRNGETMAWKDKNGNLVEDVIVVCSNVE